MIRSKISALLLYEEVASIVDFTPSYGLYRLLWRRGDALPQIISFGGLEIAL